MFKYIDESTPIEVTSKIILYHREIIIDKVIEVIGGKDEKAKVYLLSVFNY